jgi:hypothetical protein
LFSFVQQNPEQHKATNPGIHIRFVQQIFVHYLFNNVFMNKVVQQEFVNVFVQQSNNTDLFNKNLSMILFNKRVDKQSNKTQTGSRCETIRGSSLLRAFDTGCGLCGARGGGAALREGDTMSPSWGGGVWLVKSWLAGGRLSSSSRYELEM